MAINEAPICQEQVLQRNWTMDSRLNYENFVVVAKFVNEILNQLMCSHWISQLYRSSTWIELADNFSRQHSGTCSRLGFVPIKNTCCVEPLWKLVNDGSAEPRVIIVTVYVWANLLFDWIQAARKCQESAIK